MIRLLVTLAALLLAPALAWAQAGGPFVRPGCTSLTSPVTHTTACFDTTHSVGAWKVYNGSEWVTGLGQQTGVVNVKDYGALGDNSNDDTTAFQLAFHAAGQLAGAIQPSGGSLVGTHPRVIIPKGIYKLTDNIIPPSAYVKIEGIGNPIINQTVSAKNIFDFNGGYLVEVSGLTMVGGRAQIRFCNNNLNGATLSMSNLEFHRNNSAPMIEFYLGCSGAANLSTIATLRESKMMQPYRAITTVAGVTMRVQDTWVQPQNTGATPPSMVDGAVFENYNEMIFDRMYGVPDLASGASSNARWVDNRGILKIQNSRFGSEGSGGMPIVYNYAGPPQAYPWIATHSAVIIRDSVVAMGPSLATNRGIVRFQTDIPQTMILEGNTFAVQDAEQWITSAINVGTYITALAANNRLYISIKKNQGWVPLHGFGWPTALVTTDPTKVIFEMDQQPLLVPATFASPVTIDPGQGRSFLITATSNTAFTINVTLASFTGIVPAGQEMTITVKNTSGGAMGAITSGTLLKSTSWTAPADGFSRSKTFRYDGSNFVEINETTADVPN